MWPISANTNLVHNLFIGFFEGSQPFKFFYAQLCIQHMNHWNQLQLFQSLLLSFIENLYDMKGSLITSMEKCKFCILLRQC